VQAVLPFIPLDIVKCFVAAGLAKMLRKAGF
jgi:biotin transporter BioY